MLRRHGAPERLERVVDRRFDGRHPLATSGARRDHEMQVAIAEVAEGEDPGVRIHSSNAYLHRLNVRAHGANGKGDIKDLRRLTRRKQIHAIT